jgi:hypothetical protein
MMNGGEGLRSYCYCGYALITIYKKKITHTYISGACKGVGREKLYLIFARVISIVAAMDS